LPGLPGPDQLADHDRAGGDPDAHLRRDVWQRPEATNRVDDGEPGPDRALRIVLMGLWPAEIGQHAIAHVLGDMALEQRHLRRDALGEGADEVAQLFVVEAL